MKTTNRLSWLVLAGVLAGSTGPLLAQEERRGQGATGLMSVLDRNGNGKLEPEEIDLAVASLRKLDKNKDGNITREEIGGPQRSPGGGPTRGGGNFFKELDKDGDGKVSKEEAPERMKERFDRIDRNSDGFIDSEEQEAVLKLFRERSGQDGRRPGQPQRRPGGRPDSGDGQGGTDKPKRPEAAPEEK